MTGFSDAVVQLGSNVACYQNASSTIKESYGTGVGLPFAGAGLGAGADVLGITRCRLAEPRQRTTLCVQNFKSWTLLPEPASLDAFRSYSCGWYRRMTSKFLNNVTDSPDDLDRAVFDSAINRPNCRLPSASDSPS